MASNPQSQPSAPSLGSITTPPPSPHTASSTIALQQLSPSPTLPPATIPIEDEFSRPDKFLGYKAFSAWMASEDDFFIIRRFQDLNARTILWMQDRIARLEQDLKGMDDYIEKSDPSAKLRNSSLRWDEKYMEPRHRLMRELSTQLHQYNQYVETYSKVRARPRADSDQLDNLAQWQKRGAIDKIEQYHLNHEGDLISINHRTRPPLGRFLESFQKLHRLPFFRAKHVRGVHQTSPATAYSSNSRFDTITNLGIIGGGLVMLLVPLWWLDYVNDSTKKLGVMTGFIFVFVGLMSTATVNKPFEVVAATAAYAAVLMVFMQIDGKRDGS
ncbi:hypothetical protein BU23DRAFT_591869 [Bimuria novae-zelandiae CBS 107.79]|uniref:DUF6594 domain-containing protein n=1 Tax=Bimuria novae-zelandiae CBS 107.79 TaxID=1447943 RepID=A0A6A5UYP4_9PLEO|nr:hypothetical protein BU23DRAFT_591869 [Bimuria novae-zelandiae CBS 107.79]